MMSRRLTAITGLVAFTFVFFVSVSASPPISFGVPTSDRVLSGTLQLESEESPTHHIAYRAREGTLVSIEVAGQSEALAVSPAILSASPQNVGVLVLQLEGVDLGAARQIGFLDLEVGNEPVETPLGRLSVEVGEVDRASFGMSSATLESARPSQLAQRFGQTSGSSCCVTCGVVTSCATAIRMSCGTCTATPGLEVPTTMAGLLPD